MVKSSGGAAAEAKPEEKTKGAMSSAKTLAERAKAERAQKRRAPSDEDDMEDDEEEQTSDSDVDTPLIQAIEDRDRRAEKLLKLEK
jgi:hypothetical protein